MSHTGNHSRAGGNFHADSPADRNSHTNFRKGGSFHTNSRTGENFHADSRTGGNAREIALSVLMACEKPGVRADMLLRTRLNHAELSPADAALCTRMVFGVFQNRLLLDFYLSAFCTQELSHLQEPLTNILRLGAYQIVFMDRVPDHAAVDESVRLARKMNREKACGLVNAVLRTLARNRSTLPALPEKNKERYLSLRYSHPVWMVRKMVSLLGAEEAERFLAANQTIPPLSVQVNFRRTSEKNLIASLAAEGVTASAHERVKGCLELSGAGDILKLSAFREGQCFVQDPAAALVVQVADVHAGQRILDVCAAPGGKTFAAAIAMACDSTGNLSAYDSTGKAPGTLREQSDDNKSAPNGFIMACDVNEPKLRRVRDGAERLGLSDLIQTRQADGRVFHPEWKDAFDTVLVDAPCSGLGTIRKKPDIRYRDEKELSGLPDVQKAILNNAAAYVKPGGTLIYSTCTVLPEENEHVTEDFLHRHGEFSAHGFTVAGMDCPGGQITLWPQSHHTDGFYICRMEKCL